MRHEGVSEEVFAPAHITLRGTGAQAHPEAGTGVAERCRGLASLSCSKAPIPPSIPGWHSPLALQEKHHVVNVHAAAGKVCAQQARLCVADVEGLKTLAQLVGCGDGSQWAGQVLSGPKAVSTQPLTTAHTLHPTVQAQSPRTLFPEGKVHAHPGTHRAAAISAVIVAEHGIGHLEGHIIRVGPARPLHCNGYMGQRQGIITVAYLKQYMARLRDSQTTGRPETVPGVGEVCACTRLYEAAATGRVPTGCGISGVVTLTMYTGSPRGPAESTTPAPGGSPPGCQ